MNHCLTDYDSFITVVTLVLAQLVWPTTSYYKTRDDPLTHHITHLVQICPIQTTITHYEPFKHIINQHVLLKLIVTRLGRLWHQYDPLRPTTIHDESFISNGPFETNITCLNYYNALTYLGTSWTITSHKNCLWPISNDCDTFWH